MARDTQATATLGIDLAAQPRDTAICLIDWNADGTGVVHMLDKRADDDDLITTIMRDEISRVGIDAPFGTPVKFISAVPVSAARSVLCREPAVQISGPGRHRWSVP